MRQAAAPVPVSLQPTAPEPLEDIAEEAAGQAQGALAEEGEAAGQAQETLAEETTEANSFDEEQALADMREILDRQDEL